ncbi:MAG TPA: tRNA (adenosine(37)-N6)-threonylcarbamoyltransferase complex ATPase subunit type 1 TsaE [Microthrixaceae bacterium]|nr:tRNA (adenosine(37)-N6)-threonylcarbamoyltransferase complex ATPase subunit type 1 TsaE [Microthrixaceae bacterium]
MIDQARLVARTASVLETRDLAAALAELARPSDLLVLVGELGAGKTAFTQGFGRGLGIDEQITSPTFALVRSYTGRLDLYHLDVYRLEQVSEALDLGLSELLDDGSVTVIEWGDTIAPALPHDYLEVHLRFDVPDGPAPPGESSAPATGAATEAAAEAAAGSAEVFERRIVELRPIGPRWSARVRALGAALAPWTEGGADAGDADAGTGERGAPTERDGVGEC